MARILIVEPDPGRQAGLRSRVQDEGHEVHSLEPSQRLLAEVRSARADLILVADELGTGEEGLDVARRLVRADDQDAPVFVCSALPSTAERIERVLAAGCEGFVGKSELGALGSIISRSLAHRAELEHLGERQQALELENRRLREETSPGQGSGNGERSEGGPHPGALEDPDHGRPTALAILVTDGAGVVLHADLGARELLGPEVHGRPLGALATGTGLEGFVRDTRTEQRGGYRFELQGRGGKRTLVASVVPLAPDSRGTAGTGQRVVTLSDGSRASSDAPTALHHELAALLENARETYRPEAWIGQSALARGLRMAVAELVELRDAPVLLQGPRGTGKELLGRILHYSGRVSGPFLRQRCSGVSPEHLARELFGDVRGEASGLCRLASGGTLFLEEIGGLPLPLQHRLLDVMETGAVHDARGRAFPIAVRWVVASSEELRGLVEQERFLEPLYSKLRAHELITTPLATRSEDLLDLVQHFLTRYGASSGIFRIEPEALQAMQRYSWPGNVDELADCVEQACAKARGESIELEDLSRAVRSGGAGSIASLVGGREAAGLQVGRPLSTMRDPAPAWEPRPWEITDSDPINLDHYQKKALLRALARCGGDKVAAAKLLNVGKSTFYRKLKRYGITEVPGASPR